MVLGRARLVSAQATALAAGILWPQQAQARHRMTAFHVILGGSVQKGPQLQSAQVIVRLGDTRMPPPLQDQPQATAPPVTQVDLVLEAALLASVLATVLLDAIQLAQPPRQMQAAASRAMLDSTAQAVPHHLLALVTAQVGDIP